MGDLDEEKLDELERTMSNQFENEIRLHASEHPTILQQDPLNAYVMAQHHGAPTRLLDWTKSVFIAAFFATIDRVDKDGAIWVVDTTGFEMQRGVQQKTRFVTPEIDSARYVVQQSVMSITGGIFSPEKSTLSEQEQILQLSKGIWKVVVPRNLKPRFIHRLKAMNMSAKFLFPGLDGLAKSMKEILVGGTASYFEELEEKKAK